LKEAGISIPEINYIFITHFHPDHVADLISLLFAYFHNGTFKNPLDIFGPVGLNAFWKNQLKTYGQWINSPIFSFHELKKNTLDLSNLSLSWKKVSHNEESIGYRFEFEDKIITFSGDSGYCPELIELSKNANIAVIECAYPDSQADPHHLNPSAISKIANLSGAKKIILTHLYPEVFSANPVQIIRNTFQGSVVIGNDLDQFVL
jgi:ribonuclease BN (tRNA processing enzyme)